MKFTLCLFAALLFRATTAFATLATVSSSNDGNGLFSYTFSLGTDPYVWGLANGNGTIALRSEAVLQIYSPAGWSGTWQPDGWVNWSYTGPGTVFIGEPSLTFSILSESTTAIAYNEPLAQEGNFPRGVIGGGAYTYPDHTGLAVGYESFDFIGPAPIPEPATGTLLSIGAISLLALKRRQVFVRR